MKSKLAAATIIAERRMRRVEMRMGPLMKGKSDIGAA